MDLRLYILALSSGLPKTGLALADFKVDIWSVKKSDKPVSHLVTNAEMQFEIGGENRSPRTFKGMVELGGLEPPTF